MRPTLGIRLRLCRDGFLHERNEVMSKAEDSPTFPSRRDFLKTSTAAAVAAGFTRVPGAWAAGTDTIRVGVIGCGGRGTGAAANVLIAAPGVKLVAMGDTFKDRLEGSKAQLLKDPILAPMIDVTPERSFVGLDAVEIGRAS